MTSEGWKKYSPTDPELIDKIVNNIKSKGIFDQFRKDCLADVDTKPAYQNLQQRVTGTVTGFLATQKWQHGLNKTQLRESLRRHTVQQAFLEVGVDRIVDQVVNPKIFSVFTPKVEDVVCELLGIEKPKPRPLALNFQQFKKSLEAPPRLAPAPAPAPQAPSAPSPEIIKEEEPSKIEQTEETPISQEQPPPDEKPSKTSPIPSEKEEDPEETKDEPASPAGSPPEELNNDDDSNTIDEMPLLAASLDSDSDRGDSPLMDGVPQNSITKIGALSELSNSHSLLSRPPLEFENSTNNLSSLKSEEKMSPSKKFDNFSNLGEKLKQADVNLRETSVVKKDDIVEESSDVTKSSENDTESLEMKLDPPSESNLSSVDAFRHESTKMDTISERLFSEDSRSSLNSLKNKSGLIEKRDDRSHKHDKKSANSTLKERDSKTLKVDVKEESSDSIKDCAKRDYNKGSHSSKHQQSKSRCKDDNKEKCKSPNDKDKPKSDKQKSSKEKSHNSDKHGKSDAARERRDKKCRDEKKNGDSKVADSNEHSDKKREHDRSRHNSKDSKDSKSHRKAEDNSRQDSKENAKSEKEKNWENDKSKKDSGLKSSHSKSDDRKHKEDKKKDNKKDNDDDKKKSPRKRKSGRCGEDELKSKNSRRSSDRDSNGNAGGASGKSKPSSSSSSHNGRKSSKSEKGRSHTKSKEASNHSEMVEDDYEMNLNMELDEADEVDMILMEINNSIQNENQRLNISEVLSEPSVKKPKIARNFHEIKKIMQARKDIDRRISNDMKSSTPQLGNNLEERDDNDVASCDAETEQEIRSYSNKTTSSNTTTDSVERSVTVEDDLHEEVNEDYVEEVPSDSSGEIQLKDCSIVVTDVLKDQLKNSSISSLQNKRIILEDGVVKNVTKYYLSDELDGSTMDVSFTENPIDSITYVDEQSSRSSDLPTSILAIENTPIQLPVVPSESMTHVVGDESSTGHGMISSTGWETKGPESAQMEFGDCKDSTYVPKPASCNVTVPPKCELDEHDSEHMEGNITLDMSGIGDRPSCSSDVQQQRESDLKSLPLSGVRKLPKETSTAVETTNAVDGNGSDESRTSHGSNRLKRRNAGRLMYAILGTNERNLPSNQSVAGNRNAKRQGAKLDSPKNFESVSDTEVRNPGDNSRSSQASDSESLKAEEPVKTCSVDDGSDMSNKENDETKVAGKTRSQTMDLGTVETKNMETRTTRRKALSNDLSDDFKSVDNNNITKGRVSLKCKNNRGEPECLSGEIPGKMDVDHDGRKHNTSVSSRYSTRKGATPLYSRNIELEKGLIVNSSADSSAPNSLLDKDKFSEESCCKSMESLHMDKENITVPSSTCGTTVEQCLISLRRRKSCPDIFDAHEIDKIQISSNERVPISAQQEKCLKSNTKISEGTLFGGNHLQKGTLAQSGTPVSTTRRSARRLGNAGNKDSLLKKDNENGSRLIRNSCTMSQTSDVVLKQTGKKLPSHKERSKLDSPTIATSIEQSASSEEQTLVVADMKHPCSITINVDPPANTISEDESPQVMLYFDDSPAVSFRSERIVPKLSAPTLSMEINGDKSRVVENFGVEGPSSCSTTVHPQDSLLEDSCSSEFKGFGLENPPQDYFENEYRGFTNDEVNEATAQLRLLKQYIANRIQSPTKATDANELEGPPRAKKTRVASECVGSTNRNTRKRNFSLNSSPDKEKKEVLGGQCKAESKDSGLCESPEQISFASEMCRNDADVESGDSTVRSRKTNAPPTTGLQQASKKPRSSGTPNNQHSSKTRMQSYSKTDLYKPRTVVAREIRVSKTIETPATTRGRPKRST